MALNCPRKGGPPQRLAAFPLGRAILPGRLPSRGGQEVLSCGGVGFPNSPPLLPAEFLRLQSPFLNLLSSFRLCGRR